MSEDPVTPDPSADAERTSDPAILRTFPLARSRCSEDVNAPVALAHWKVLSVAPFTVIPAPSAVVFVGDATTATSMFLSFTARVAVSIVVVVPLTRRFPETVKS